MPRTCRPTLRCMCAAGSLWRIESALEMVKEEVRSAQRPELEPPMILAPSAWCGQTSCPSGHPKKARGIGQLDSFPTGPRPGRGLTVPKIRQLWRHLLLPVVTDIEQVLAWSGWCRHHQWVAMHFHYRRQPVTTLQITTVVLVDIIELNRQY